MRVLHVLAVYHLSRRPSSNKIIDGLVAMVQDMDTNTYKKIMSYRESMNLFVQDVRNDILPIEGVDMRLRTMASDATDVDVSVFMEFEKLNQAQIIETAKANTRRYNDVLSMACKMMRNCHNKPIDAEQRSHIESLQEQLSDPNIVNADNEGDVKELRYISCPACT